MCQHVSKGEQLGDLIVIRLMILVIHPVILTVNVNSQTENTLRMTD